MIEVKIKKDDEFIKLGQLLKKIGVASSGSEARYFIEEEMVEVNGEVTTQRGKKIIEGDIISFEGESYKVIK